MWHFVRKTQFFTLLLSLTFEVNAFEFLIFAQQHPPGYCRSTFKEKCIVTKMTENFTIHGLWPSAKNDKVQNCDRRKFDVNDVLPLKERLQQAWPSFKSNDSTSFWAHEWRRHGTCGSNSSELADAFRYFNATLTLHERYNLLEYLRNDDIVPSSKISYTTQAVRTALSNDIKGKVQLICDKADNFKYPILTEVRFCLDENFEIYDCSSKGERCGKSRIFLLPLKDSANGASRITTNAQVLAQAFLVSVVISTYLLLVT